MKSKKSDYDILNSLNDEEKWKWVKNNQDKNILILLDEDETYISFKNNNSGYFRFDEHIGDSCGVISLLSSLGIKSERW